MIRVYAVCQGISPILMNRMTDETLDSLITGVRKPVQKDRPFEEVAEEKIYRDEQGNTGVPSENLFACLAEAGRSVKLGKKQISTASSTILPSFLSIEELFLPFIDDPEWVVDKRRGQSTNGANKVAVGIIRPKFLDWKFGVTLEIDESEASPDTVRELLAKAGKSIGLGDFRPAKKGPFGRFEVASWKVLDGDEAATATSSNGQGSKEAAKEVLAATA